MSHVTEIKTQIKDLQALEAAAKQLGMELVKDQKKYKWYGIAMSANSVPPGFTAADLGNCEHALRIPGNSKAYEIGVVKRKDGQPGYTLLWDNWSGGYGLTAKVGQTGENIKKEYAAQVAIKQARREGWKVKREVKPNGEARLRLTR